MIGSELEIIVYLVLVSLLLLGSLYSVKDGLYSPHFLFYVYLLVGIGLRRLYLNDTSDFDDLAFWLEVSPKVRDTFVPAYLELIGVISIAALSSRYLFRKSVKAFDPLFSPFAFRSTDIKFYVTVLLGIACCIAFLIGLSISQGSVVEAFKVLQKRALTFGSEIFFIRLLLVGFSACSCLLVYKVSYEKKSTSLFNKAVVISLVSVNLILLFLTGGRGDMVSQLLTLLYVRSRGLKKPGISLRDGLFLGISMIVIVVTGLAMRNKAQMGISFIEALTDAIPALGLTISGTFPILDLYLAARFFAQSVGYDYGLQFLMYFARFLPRSMWEDKPQVLGLQIREFFSGTTLSGAPPTVFGEFYIAGGLVGVVVCGLFLGWILAVLRRLYFRSKKYSDYSLIYIFLVASIIFNSLRAGLEIGVFSILYFLVTLCVIRFLFRFQIRKN